MASAAPGVSGGRPRRLYAWSVVWAVVCAYGSVCIGGGWVGVSGGWVGLGGGVGLEGLLEDLGDVEHLDGVAGGAVGLFGGDGVGEHDHAERAGGGDQVGVEAEGFFGAFDVDAFPDFFFHPESGAAGAAAEAALFAAVHFLGGE